MSFKYPITCLLLSALCVVAFLILGLSNSHEWFSRGGALVTLFGIAAEYSLIQIQTKYLSSNFRGVGALSGGKIDSFSVPTPYPLIQISAHLMVILGTLIWGFGDWCLNWIVST